jgi:hypothetical protein
MPGLLTFILYILPILVNFLCVPRYFALFAVIDRELGCGRRPRWVHRPFTFHLWRLCLCLHLHCSYSSHPARRSRLISASASGAFTAFMAS